MASNDSIHFGSSYCLSSSSVPFAVFRSKSNAEVESETLLLPEPPSPGATFKRTLPAEQTQPASCSASLRSSNTSFASMPPVERSGSQQIAAPVPLSRQSRSSAAVPPQRSEAQTQAQQRRGSPANEPQRRLYRPNRRDVSAPASAPPSRQATATPPAQPAPSFPSFAPQQQYFPYGEPSGFYNNETAIPK